MSYAPHLKSSTLPNVPIKPVLWQVAQGDRTLPNPASTNLIRAANMRESTSFYRHDLARLAAPLLPQNPHTYLLYFAGTELGLGGLASPPIMAIARAAQAQMAGFFASDGDTIPDPNEPLRPLFGRNLFEMPLFLTEDLNF